GPAAEVSHDLGVGLEGGQVVEVVPAQGPQDQPLSFQKGSPFFVHDRPCWEPSAGAKNTKTVRSSVMSKKRCSTSRSTKRMAPGRASCTSAPARNLARPVTT